MTLTTIKLRDRQAGEPEIQFKVEPNCEHDSESCECICSCGWHVIAGHEQSLYGPYNEDLPANKFDNPDGDIYTCPDAPILHTEER